MSRARMRKRLVATFASALCVCGGVGLWLTGGTASAAPSSSSSANAPTLPTAASTVPGSTSTTYPTASITSATTRPASPASPVHTSADAPDVAAQPQDSGTSASGSGTLKAPGILRGAWLSPAQLPDVGLSRPWTVSSPARARTLAEDVWVPMCPGVGGETSWLVEDYSAGTAQASQQTLLFTSAAQAQQAYRQMTAELEGCQALSRRMQVAQGVPATAVVSETYQTPDASSSSWRRVWDGVSTPISTPGAQTDLEYLARSGAAVTVLDLTLPGTNGARPSAAETAALLSALTTALGDYADGGS